MVRVFKNTHLRYDDYQTFHMVHKLIPIIYMKLHCLVNTKIFIKILNHFNHFLNIFLLLVCSNICFWHNYIITSHHMKFKNVSSLAFDFFGFWPTIICKKIVNFFIIKTWLKFKHGTFEKKIQCDNNLGPP
jgi:hypothetical protein